MEPEIQGTESKQTHPVLRVTTLSKYLALLLFILMPFVGGYVGYMYAPEKVVEVEKIIHNSNEIEVDLADVIHKSKMSTSSEEIISPNGDYLARIVEKGSRIEILDMVSREVLYSETAFEASKTLNGWSTFIANQCDSSSILSWIDNNTLEIAVFDSYLFGTGKCEATFTKNQSITVGVTEFECFENENYFVISPLWGDTHPYIVKEKHNYIQPILCKYELGPNDIELEKYGPDSVTNIVDNHVFFDRGTSMIRAILIYDLDKKEFILEDATTNCNFEFILSEDYIRYCSVADQEMSEDDCTDIDREEWGNWGVGLNEYVEFNFTTGKETLIEKECARRE